MDRTTAEVDVALAGVRRRERLLDEARGKWSWRDLGMLIPLAIASYWIWSGPGEVSTTTLGFILVVSSLGGWQLQRLHARVDALSNLVADLGYPREA